MALIDFTTECQATLIEEWRVETPDNLTGDELYDYLNGQLQDGNAHFLSEKGENEHDRDITVIDGERLRTF